MTGTTLSVGSSVDSWATGTNMWSRRHWRCLFSFYCLFSEDLNLPVHIFKENVLSTTGDNILSVLRKTLFLLCLGQVNYVFVLNVTIFSLGIYCVKVLVFGLKLCLEILFSFVYFRGVKNTSFISKSSTSASKIDLGGVNASANTDYIQSFLRKRYLLSSTYKSQWDLFTDQVYCVVCKLYPLIPVVNFVLNWTFCNYRQ